MPPMFESLGAPKKKMRGPKSLIGNSYCNLRIRELITTEFEPMGIISLT